MGWGNQTTKAPISVLRNVHVDNPPSMLSLPPSLPPSFRLREGDHPLCPALSLPRGSQGPQQEGIISTGGAGEGEEGERKGGRGREGRRRRGALYPSLSLLSPPSHSPLFSSSLPPSLYPSLHFTSLPPSLPPSLSISLFLPPLTNSLLPLLRSGKEGSSVTPTSSTSSLPCS